MYALIGLMVGAVAFFFLKNKSSDVTDDAAESADSASGGWTKPSVPEMPSFNVEQVWTQCHAACDSSRGFVEKFVGGGSTEEAAAVSESQEL